MQIWTGSISDDSGFLGLINPATYASFVDEDWDLEQLFQHFRNEMKKQNLLLWGTGRECEWNACVELGNADRPRGFREVSGPIVVSDAGLCLINYESLTMGAQFPDVRLPEAHLEYCHFSLNPGIYLCSIVQMLDPSSEESPQSALGFVVVVNKTGQLPDSWTDIPWYNR